jgi:hypothetical protein
VSTTLKPGDLAVVKGCPIGDCNGQIVEIVSFFGELRDFGPSWNCSNNEMREEGFPALPIPDSMLFPISGVPLNDEQPNEVTA